MTQGKIIEHRENSGKTQGISSRLERGHPECVVFSFFETCDDCSSVQVLMSPLNLFRFWSRYEMPTHHGVMFVNSCAKISGGISPNPWTEKKKKNYLMSIWTNLARKIKKCSTNSWRKLRE